MLYKFLSIDLLSNISDFLFYFIAHGIKTKMNFRNMKPCKKILWASGKWQEDDILKFLLSMKDKTAMVGSRVRQVNIY